MNKINIGSKGNLVEKWQVYLRGRNYYKGVVDGDFGPITKKATLKYQKDNWLYADGVVGNQTWGHALLNGLEIIKPEFREDAKKKSPNWPSQNIKPISFINKIKQFGQFKFTPKYSKANPEGIIILGDWVAKNIERVEISQLKGILGAPKSGRIFLHKAIVQQTIDMFQAFDDAGLGDRVISFAGSWVPRFVRGSRSNLSNHSWGTAFDINAPQNWMGSRPALVGQKGCVRELVPIAEDFGFFWGGFWGSKGPGVSRGRTDGMHFEAAKIQ